MWALSQRGQYDAAERPLLMVAIFHGGCERPEKPDFPSIFRRLLRRIGAHLSRGGALSKRHPVCYGRVMTLSDRPEVNHSVRYRIRTPETEQNFTVISIVIEKVYRWKVSLHARAL